jgi:hypothetical protein
MTLLAVALAHSWHRAFLIDDAYISFRYARNLAEGNGLVFNIGDRVEGYTNFLWTLMMAGAARLGLDPAPVSQAAGLVSSALLLWILYLWGRDLGFGTFWSLVTTAMLAVNRSYAAWATSGLETRFFTLLLVAGAWRLHAEIRSLREGGSAAPISAILFALACLTRPEGILAAAVAAVGLLISSTVRRGGKGWSFLIQWSAVVLVLVGAHVAWRRTYYGEWLPNSFYAKVPGIRSVSGALYLAEFAKHNLLLPAIPVIVFLGIRLREALSRMRATLAPLGILVLPFTGLYLLYTCLVGGDHFEFRFLDPVLPWLYLSAAALCSHGANEIGDRPGMPRRALAAALVIASGISSLIGFRDVDRQVTMGAQTHYSSIVSVETEQRYLDRWEKIGRWLRDHAGPSESIAVAPSGAIPYFSGLRTLDMLGINDHEIARMPVEPGLNVGHERWVETDFIRDRGITYYIGSPRIQPKQIPDRPQGAVEVDLGEFYWYFWPLQPGATIYPESTHAL